MSRIGKQPIIIPNEVSAKVADTIIEIKGPKGSLSYDFGYDVKVEIKDKEIIVSKLSRTQQAQSLWGTTRSIINNMVEGVANGFKKQLELHGVGYKMAIQGNKLVLNLGFSHPIEAEIPEGITATIEKNVLTVEGVDKQSVGQFAAVVRGYRKVEPYKGKGMRYVGEHFIKKEGKRAVGTE